MRNLEDNNYNSRINVNLGSCLDFRRSLATGGREERVSGLDSRGQYCRNYLTVYELMTHATHMDTDDLLSTPWYFCIHLYKAFSLVNRVILANQV